MQAKVIQASNASELEQAINAWLKDRVGIRIQKMKMEVDQHKAFVVVLLYTMPEPEVC